MPGCMHLRGSNQNVNMSTSRSSSLVSKQTERDGYNLEFNANFQFLILNCISYTNPASLRRNWSPACDRACPFSPLIGSWNFSRPFFGSPGEVPREHGSLLGGFRFSTFISLLSDKHINQGNSRWERAREDLGKGCGKPQSNPSS